MTKHFVCTECSEESKSAGTCSVDSCVNQGEALKECYCDDGLHALVLNKKTGGESPNPMDDSGEEMVTSSKPVTLLDLDSKDES